MNHSDTIKEQHRKELLKQPSQLLSKNKAKDICELPIIRSSQHIACYKALKPEVDITNLLILLEENNKKIYLPIPNDNNTLSFAEWRLNEPLIFEKKCWVPRIKKIHEVEDLDCIIIPCLGIDLNHQRLGRDLLQFVNIPLNVSSPKVVQEKDTFFISSTPTGSMGST